MLDQHWFSPLPPSFPLSVTAALLFELYWKAGRAPLCLCRAHHPCSANGGPIPKALNEPLLPIQATEVGREDESAHGHNPQPHDASPATSLLLLWSPCPPWPLLSLFPPPFLPCWPLSPSPFPLGLCHLPYCCFSGPPSLTHHPHLTAHL